MAADHPEPPAELEELLWSLCKASPKASQQQIESGLLRAILNNARLKEIALKHADALISRMPALSWIQARKPAPGYEGDAMVRGVAASKPTRR
jgi:hypothetical protein